MSLDIQVSSTDIVDGFVIDHESAVGVLQGCMSCQDRVIRFNNSSRDLRSWIDGELQFGFLSEVNRQSLHQQGGETRTGATTKRVEN